MQSNKTKRSVIESAEHSLTEAERQVSLGSASARTDAAYWAAYLDGARDQKKEDDRWWNEFLFEDAEGSDDK